MWFIYLSIYSFICLSICWCVCVNYLYLYTHTYVCVCVRVCMYVCMYACGDIINVICPKVLHPWERYWCAYVHTHTYCICRYNVHAWYLKCISMYALQMKDAPWPGRKTVHGCASARPFLVHWRASLDPFDGGVPGTSAKKVKKCWFHVISSS